MAHTDGIARPPSRSAMSSTIAAGTTLAGRYEVIGLLGEGGMGAVYEAHDRLLGQRVALKVMRPDRTDDRTASRFRREIQLARLISHPNVCRVHDVIVESNADVPRVFLSMELVKGETLADRIRRGAMGVHEATPIVHQLVAALSASHEAGVVHRDLKPSNVLLEPATQPDAPPRVVVTDFGIARAVELPDDAATLTGTGEVLGTPAYMAPEQAGGEEVTPATDIYALGLILYEMVTGQAPFGDASKLESTRVEGARDPLARLIKRLSEPIPSPRLLAPRLPSAWEATILRCLQRDPSRRYQRAEELLAALEGRGHRRWPRWLALGLIAAGTAATLAWAIAPTTVPLLEPTLAVSASERLTFDLGCEEYPAFSPDGGTLYYTAVINGDAEIVARDMATGHVRAITTSPGIDYGAAVSRDGRFIAFINQDKLRELRVIDPATGKQEVLGPGWSTPAWSPQNHLLAGDYGGRLLRWTHDAGTWTSSVVAETGGGMPVRHLAFSRDRLFGMLVRVSDRQMHLAELTGGKVTMLAERVTDRHSDLAASEHGVYYSQRTLGGSEQMVYRRHADGLVSALPGGLPARSGFTPSPNGRSFVYSTCGAQYYLAHVSEQGRERELTPRGEFDFDDLAPLDDQRVLLTSNRAGDWQGWSLDPSTLEMKPLTPPGTTQVSVSADAQWVTYTDTKRGGIAIRATGGGEARQLTSDATDTEPHVTHDNRHVIFRRGARGGERVFIIDREGGEPRAISPVDTPAGLPSPTEDLIVLMVKAPGGFDLLVTNSRGDAPKPLSPQIATGDFVGLAAFSRDGRHLLVGRDGGRRIDEVPMNGQPPRTLLQSTGDLVGSATYAPNGDGILVTQRAWDGDLWIASGVFP